MGPKGQWNPGVMPPLLSTDPYKLHVMYNKIDGDWGVTLNYIENMRIVMPTAVRLIAFLKEKYDLD
jgi:hypothetical protein